MDSISSKSMALCCGRIGFDQSPEGVAGGSKKESSGMEPGHPGEERFRQSQHSRLTIGPRLTVFRRAESDDLVIRGGSGLD